MTQNWNDNTYALTDTGTTNLQTIENNFACLRSAFSGASAPASVAGQFFFDTTNKILKIRNQANSAWLGVMYGAADYKMWVYINSAGDGWTVDATVTDKVLAIKGGANAYNISGGASGGTWTQPTHTHTFTTTEVGDHLHQIRKYNGGLSAQYYNASGVLTNFAYTSITTSSTAYDIPTVKSYDPGGDPAVPRIGVKADWYSEDTGAHDHEGPTDGGETAATYRPAAAVGTLQYLNI